MILQERMVAFIHYGLWPRSAYHQSLSPSMQKIALFAVEDVPSVVKGLFKDHPHPRWKWNVFSAPHITDAWNKAYHTAGDSRFQEFREFGMQSIRTNALLHNLGDELVATELAIFNSAMNAFSKRDVDIDLIAINGFLKDAIFFASATMLFQNFDTLAPEIIQHAKDRWEVWQAGHGVAAGDQFSLWVYGIKPTEKLPGCNEDSPLVPGQHRCAI